MTRVMMQMILLGTVLTFNRTSASNRARNKTSKCISEDELEKRRGAYERRYWNRTSVFKAPAPAPPKDARSCAQAAREMHGDVNHRALSPWRHYLDHDANRIPHEISFAKCLCQGCIIRQQEDLTYNSVLVFSELKVLKKTRCPSDPKKFVIQNDFIQVPVACTCVVPKYVK